MTISRETGDFGHLGNNENLLINGNFDIWQRGISFSAVGYYADRWASSNLGGTTFTSTREAFTVGQTDVPNNPKYYLELDVTVGGGNPRGIIQSVESVYTAAGKNLTMSFYAKADAAIDLIVQATQDFGDGGSSAVAVNDTVTLTTSWAKYAVTLAIPSISGKTVGDNSNLGIIFRMNNVTARTLHFAQAKAEISTVATAFIARPIAEELALCQRYYEHSFSTGFYPGDADVSGSHKYVASRTFPTNATMSGCRFKISKRGLPTITLFSTNDGSSGYVYNASGAANREAEGTNIGVEGFNMRWTATSSLIDEETINWNFAADAEF